MPAKNAVLVGGAREVGTEWQDLDTGLPLYEAQAVGTSGDWSAVTTDDLAQTAAFKNAIIVIIQLGNIGEGDFSQWAGNTFTQTLDPGYSYNNTIASANASYDNGDDPGGNGPFEPLAAADGIFIATDSRTNVVPDHIFWKH